MLMINSMKGLIIPNYGGCRFRALKVCQDYGYKVEFTGVGPAPPGQQESIGFCSQIGVFHRLGGRDIGSALFEDLFSYTLVSRLCFLVRPSCYSCVLWKLPTDCSKTFNN